MFLLPTVKTVTPPVIAMDGWLFFAPKVLAAAPVRLVRLHACCNSCLGISADGVYPLKI